MIFAISIIAAVIFAHEAIIGHYSLRAFAPITIAAVTGNEVAKMNGRFFDGFQNLTEFRELLPEQYPLFAIVGLISAVFALIYMRSLVAVGKDWPAVSSPSGCPTSLVSSRKPPLKSSRIAVWNTPFSSSVF